ncbi:histidine kinase dimerization/phospho-acceptor domain-containing protein [Dyadobacter subterraneus]|uniref:histidine kinase n=1 Tax=Dyadobacter subterraneus TaxID=2773304 RepID=A0ABR9WB59_9BACT|nr:HAMP domain-containing sensor histidine kinase [Dyadobacter subterraneus]MBE9462695.1 HAMP domain-containing histidine kinase [Dyadobacter subterraneus]
MKTPVSYPFYSSLRFRFGLIFGFVFLCFLLIAGFTLYSNVRQQFEKSFAARLQTQGNAILRQTDVSPLTIPLPTQNEYFLLIYQANDRQDTLFNNLPIQLKSSENNANSSSWRYKVMIRNLETGASIRIVYMLAATELTADINRLKIILFFYFPVSFLAALVAGYFLSGFLLRPVENIVKKADQISLQNQIILLEEPAVRDELHKLTGSLNNMLNRIQKQAKEQNAFFASASHELRTPLSVMLTELQIIDAGSLVPDIKSVIENQIVEVRRLNKLVNDFLLMSQLKSRALILNKSQVNLPELAIEILESLTKKAQLKSQTFKVALVPETGTFNVFTDQSHLKTMLSNLIENAIRHGRPESAIDIEVIQVNQGIVFEIKNESLMAVSDISVITNEFSKQDLNNEGFGLGLWIVSRLCEIIGAEFRIFYIAPYFRVELGFKNEQ